MHKPVLIGMNNPLWRKGGDEKYALYPAPEGCTGHRLYEMLTARTGCMRIDYINTFDRRNLIQGPHGWDTNKAEEAAAALYAEFFGTGRVIVLLGEDVRRSFKMKKELLHPIEDGGCTWRQVPHPSGRNPWYNHQENRNLVAVLLEELYYGYKP